jgi:hypothetical protein
MKDDNNILDKAINTLKNESVQSGPGQEVIDATLSKLAEAQPQTDSRQALKFERFKIIKSFSKLAAAAVLMIFVGYTAGRLSTPRLDTEQLKSEIEASLRASMQPEVRDQVINEMKPYLQLGFTNCYMQLKDDLTEQYRQDLSRFASQTLAASNTVTNQILAKLIESFQTAQVQDRQWMQAAIEQTEINRVQDNAQLSNVFVKYATQTENEFQRTKQDIARLLYYKQPESELPENIEN